MTTTQKTTLFSSQSALLEAAAQAAILFRTLGACCANTGDAETDRELAIIDAEWAAMGVKVVR